MMDEEIIKSSEIEDWIKELLPDFSADHMGIGTGVTFPYYGLSNYNQQNKSIASMTSNNNNNNNNPIMWQHQQSDNLNNSVNQSMEGSVPTLFQEFSHNQTSSNLVSNFPQHQLFQNQVVEQAAVERPNIYQFSTKISNSYPSNSRQNRQMQTSPGCRSTNFMAKHQDKFNVLQQSEQMSAFNQAQNVTLIDQMKPGNQSQTLSESIPQSELTNSIDWMDQAYNKILQMKEMFSPEVITLYKRVQEARQSANNAETVNRCEKIRISAERVISFLRMSRSDISRWRKEKLRQTMNDVVKYLHQARASNSLAQKQNQRVEPNVNCVRLENIFQFNSSTQSSINQSSACQVDPMRSKQTGFDQRALKMLLDPTQLNNNYIFGQSDHSVSHNKQQNDQAIKRHKNKQQQQIVQRKNEEKNRRRFAGFNQRGSPLSAGAISPQTSHQSGSQVELKDLSSSSSKFSKSATVSVSASSSAFPSPLTPLTLCSKPVGFAKSPLSIDKSYKFPQNSVDPSLQDTIKNLIVADSQEVMKSVGNTESTDKQSSRDEENDPVKRLIDVVTSMSPRALNSAIQDIDAVTSLTDRIATNFLQGDSTKVVFQDLADDINKFRMQSTTKDQMETTTLNQMKSETQFCVSDSGKRLKKEPSDLLFQEIKEINQRFMEVKVDVMMNMDDVSRIGFYEGILIRCSYVPVGPASQQMIHKLLLELIVPADYPRISPTVSQKMPPGCGDPGEGKDLWTKAMSNFSLKLRKLSQPITVKQMARAWEASAREVFIEYAKKMGGGSFSSRYGKWDSFTVAF